MPPVRGARQENGSSGLPHIEAFVFGVGRFSGPTGGLPTGDLFMRF
jgi:hypothetical protein